MKQILFVCTGNTCRSPMAEGLLRTMAEQEGIDLSIRSAGLAAVEGYPISAYSLQILRSKGMKDDLSSQPVSTESVEWADLILTMTAGHKRSLVRQYPDAADKIHTLKEFTEDDPAVLEALRERGQLSAELEIKRALGQPISDEEKQRLADLDRFAMEYDTDIDDPIGGSLEAYKCCADEIEDCLAKLLAYLRGENGNK
ncbi:protein-tyrosine-phosphatase [Paenibacillus sp. J31TS4]|uniref:low molecular weight protein arginine phosphatase n=1 Tax=Paenibacillus sp. J31TS4 TaxID=2807195 RepID=UPI001B29F4B7|nr:low molecular weight protein arginine phosphatase [Paenibacillus sp. J31TS4]GIP40928.1 protein-tyrosine-phosphatase [Paenibacillus sp. J31TS4]